MGPDPSVRQGQRPNGPAAGRIRLPRYGLPVFVTLKPRPYDVAYARASKQSMGRPPDFIGDHAEVIAVFTFFLSLKLLGP